MAKWMVGAPYNKQLHLTPPAAIAATQRPVVKVLCQVI